MITIPTKSEGDLLYASEINEIITFINESTLHKYNRISGSSSPSFTVLDDVTGATKDSGVILIQPASSPNRKLQSYQAKISGYNMGLVLGEDFAGIVNGNTKDTSNAGIILHNTGKVNITTGDTDWGIEINTLANVSIVASDGITINGGNNMTLTTTDGVVIDTSDLQLITPNLTMPNIPGFMPGTSDPSLVTRFLFLEADGKVATLPADQLQSILDYYV